MSFTIEIDDREVTAALNRLLKATSDMSPVLAAIGEGIVERTKQRFGAGAGPDGIPWAPNSPVTLSRKKSGKGPLHGESGDLARQFHYIVSGNTLTVGSSMVYAAMQQFGGTRAQFPNLWGDIPARPFLPARSDGTLYPDEQASILDELNAYFQQVIDG